MRVLITGAGGQLGRDLVRVLSDTDTVMPCDRAGLDVTDAEVVRRVFEREKPDAVIHAAAYTSVDRAEIEPDEAYRVNALGARNVAAAAAEIGAKLVHISTDYVFDGRLGRPYHEFDRPAPLSVYGRSKREGERLVRFVHTKSFIVRTSWLYDRGPHNFIGKILQAAREGRTLRVVHDEIGSPTYTADLAEFLSRLIRTPLYGIYHAANTGSCSRFELAKAALMLAGLDHVPLQPISAVDLLGAAPRPGYSVLDGMMIRLNGLAPLPNWQEGLARCLAAD